MNLFSVSRRWTQVLGAVALCAGLLACESQTGVKPSSGANTAPATAPWRTVHPGLRYAVFSPWPSSRVHVLQLDLAEPGLRLQVSPPEARGLTMDMLAIDPVVVASLNASFFDRSHTPRGLTVSDGRAWPRVLVPADSPVLACDAAQRCAMHFAPGLVAPPDWFNAVAGTPWLVRDGQARLAADDSTCASLCAYLHPRTALGLDASGRTLTVVLAEGRRAAVGGALGGAAGGAVGVALAPLAAWMRELGVHQAINLDGGGSSTLWLQGRAAMGRPANEPNERALSTALQIVRVGVADAPGVVP
jgi:Phosphodiester glycosidase